MNENNINVSSDAVIETPSKPKRIFELDFLRGLAVIAMIIDHFTVIVWASSDFGGWGSMVFSNYYEVNNAFVEWLVKWSTVLQDSTFRLVCHYIFVTLFLALCGISCTFSRSNYKRGLIVTGAGLIVTAVSVVGSLITDSDMYIIFGILTLLGVSIILYETATRIFNNKWFILSIGIILVVVGFIIQWWKVERLHAIQDINPISFIEVILGLKVYGADHFGIIPCTGVVFIGAFIGKTVYQKRQSIVPKLDGKWNKPLCFVGRKALWFYLLHQVVAVIIIGLIFLCAGYRF